MIPVKRFYNRAHHHQQQITVSNPVTDFDNCEISDEKDNEIIIEEAIDNDTVYGYSETRETFSSDSETDASCESDSNEGEDVAKATQQTTSHQNEKTYQTMSGGGVK